MLRSSRTAEGVVAAPFIQWLRAAALAGYIGVIVLCFVSPWGPRVLWTLLVPALPLFVVLAGFHTWRLVCPLALLGSLGLKLQALGAPIRRVLRLKPRPKAGSARRAPAWLEEWFFALSLGFLIVMLVCRLILINGDGRWLGLALIGLALLAALTNFLFTGRTWCNFVCPVGVVERIFTDPQLRPTASSKCAACTACKKNCPDIDQENAYWKDVSHPARRVAFYAYPGVVLAFYAYYWLRDGRWDGYLDGSSLRTAAGARLAFAPGYFFLPQMPAILAASLTMLVLAYASFSLFDLLEHLAIRWAPDAERRRHLTLSLAAFVAFNLYYVLVGPPILRGLPGAAQVLAFVIPAVSTWVLVRRWRQTGEGFAQARSARRLLPLWTLDSPPPRDPAALLAFFKGQEIARGAQLNAYREALLDVLAEGHLRSRDLRLLDRLRTELGIGDTDYQRLVTALPDDQRQLLDAKRAAQAEKQRQRDAEDAQRGEEHAQREVQQPSSPAERPRQHPHPRQQARPSASRALLTGLPGWLAAGARVTIARLQAGAREARRLMRVGG